MDPKNPKHPQDPRRRTITLTGRRPVIISEADWPVIAHGGGDSGNALDSAHHQQAWTRGELDTYNLRVRQHADGRAIVYATLSAAGAWTGSEDHRGGELLATGADLAAAIARVGQECGLPGRVIRRCLANLPAQAL